MSTKASFVGCTYDSQVSRRSLRRLLVDSNTFCKSLRLSIVRFSRAAVAIASSSKLPYPRVTEYEKSGLNRLLRNTAKSVVPSPISTIRKSSNVPTGSSSSPSS